MPDKITLYYTSDHSYQTASFERKSYKREHAIEGVIIDATFCYVDSRKKSSTVDRQKDVKLYHIVDRATGYVLGAHMRALLKQYPKLFQSFGFTHRGAGLYVSADKRFTIQSNFRYALQSEATE